MTREQSSHSTDGRKLYGRLVQTNVTSESGKLAGGPHVGGSGEESETRACSRENAEICESTHVHDLAKRGLL